MITRRQLLGAGPLALSGCSTEPGADSYAAVSAATWRSGAASGLVGVALGRELARLATLAPSSHNTQCWTFALGGSGQRLVDPASSDIRVELEPASPHFAAITQRQCTRADYDGQPLSGEDLAMLQRAGGSDRVRLLLMTDRPAMERTLEAVIQGNTAQMAAPAFVKELKAWIRFKGADAVRARDGLYSASSGNPNIPSWIGERAFRWVFTPKVENDKYARQLRSSAGIAVFVGQAADPPTWVEVGRRYERFVLQATALGIRNAFLNQPIEVASLRPAFAAALGLPGQRPDLVVRFGRGPTLPRSLRRPVDAVLV